MRNAEQRQFVSYLNATRRYNIRVKRFIQLPDYFNVDGKSDRFIGNTCDLDFNCAAI